MVGRERRGNEDGEELRRGKETRRAPEFVRNQGVQIRSCKREHTQSTQKKLGRVSGRRIAEQEGNADGNSF